MSFYPATAFNQSVPRTIERALASGYAANKGALLVLNGSNQFAECGADPAAVAAVAIGAGGADTDGFNITGRKEFPSGYMQAYWPGNGQLFLARYTGTLGTPGTAYGTVRDTDGLWKVDFAETTTTQVIFHKSLNVAPESLPLVLVSFRAAIITQIPG